MPGPTITSLVVKNVRLLHGAEGRVRGFPAIQKRRKPMFNLVHFLVYAVGFVVLYYIVLIIVDVIRSILEI